MLTVSTPHANCALTYFSWQLALLSWMLATTWTASTPPTKGSTGETRVHGPVLRLFVSIHKRLQTARLQVMLRSVCAEAMHSLADPMHTLTDPMLTLTDHLSIHNRGRLNARIGLCPLCSMLTMSIRCDDFGWELFKAIYICYAHARVNLHVVVWIAYTLAAASAH